MLDQKEIQKVARLGKQFSDVTILLHEAIAQKAGLSGTDHKYLNILIEGGPMTAGELAKLTRLTTGAVTTVIDRLEKQGLVKRAFDKTDRRKVMIVPDTKLAATLLEPSSKMLKKKMVGLVSKLTPDHQKVIESYMLDAIAAMQQVIAELSSDKP